MKLEKLPSGSFRLRKTVNGTAVSVVFDHKPNDYEIMEAITEQVHIKKTKPGKAISLRSAIDLYVNTQNIGVATIREYKRLPNRVSKQILDMDIREIDQDVIDAEIKNLVKRDLKPKTVMNYMSQITTLARKYNKDCSVNLENCPKKPRKLDDPYIPTREETKKLLDYTNENDAMYYIPFALAALCGLRREEIIALKPSDIQEDFQIRVESAVVADYDGNWVSKDTKTELSTRFVPCPEQLAKRIWLQGYVYKGHPNSINKALHRIQKENGIHEFDLHKFRHYFATELADAGVSEPDILYLGGWSKSSDVMRKIYRHSRAKQDQNRRAEIMQKMTAVFYTDVMTTCHIPAQQ